MATARSTPASLPAHEFAGIYAPVEVAGYLLATLPAERHPPTSRRILSWIRTGLVAAERQTVGRGVVIDFEGLVTCLAVSLLREAGFGLADVHRTEQLLTRDYRAPRPFAHCTFWESGTNVVGGTDGRLSSRASGAQIAWDFLAEWLSPVRIGLGFSEETARAAWWRPMAGIMLRPTVQLGQPCIEGTRIPTSAIWSYVQAGDAPAYLAQAYLVDLAAVERALAWEERVRTALGASAAVPT